MSTHINNNSDSQYNYVVPSSWKRWYLLFCGIAKGDIQFNDIFEPYTSPPLSEWIFEDLFQEACCSRIDFLPEEINNNLSSIDILTALNKASEKIITAYKDAKKRGLAPFLKNESIKESVECVVNSCYCISDIIYRYLNDISTYLAIDEDETDIYEIYCCSRRNSACDFSPKKVRFLYKVLNDYYISHDELVPHEHLSESDYLSCIYCHYKNTSKIFNSDSEWRETIKENPYQIKPNNKCGMIVYTHFVILATICQNAKEFDNKITWASDFFEKHINWENFSSPKSYYWLTKYLNTPSIIPPAIPSNIKQSDKDLLSSLINRPVFEDACDIAFLAKVIQKPIQIQDHKSYSISAITVNCPDKLYQLYSLITLESRYLLQNVGAISKYYIDKESAENDRNYSKIRHEWTQYYDSCIDNYYQSDVPGIDDLNLDDLISNRFHDHSDVWLHEYPIANRDVIYDTISNFIEQNEKTKSRLKEELFDQSILYNFPINVMPGIVPQYHDTSNDNPEKRDKLKRIYVNYFDEEGKLRRGKSKKSLAWVLIQEHLIKPTQGWDNIFISYGKYLKIIFDTYDKKQNPKITDEYIEATFNKFEYSNFKEALDEIFRNMNWPDSCIYLNGYELRKKDIIDNTSDAQYLKIGIELIRPFYNINLE